MTRPQDDPFVSGIYYVHFTPDGDAEDRPPLDPRYYADTSTATELAGLYDFELIAADNIHVHAAQPSTAATLVNVEAGTNVADTGRIDVLTNGSIDFTEIRGDFRIGDITSTASDVSLTAAEASIFAVAGVDGTTPYVTGNSISLQAAAGIAAATDFLEINSSNFATGLVYAAARDSIFLTETTGDLNLDGVVSHQADVALLTLNGSILDGLMEEEDLADVQARH